MPDRPTERPALVPPTSGDRTRLVLRIALYVAALIALTAIFAFVLRLW